MERETGLEPATSSLGSWHSTAELLPLTVFTAICLISKYFRTLDSVYTVYTVYPVPPGQIEKWTVKQTVNQTREVFSH